MKKLIVAGQSERPWTTPAYWYIRLTDNLPRTDEAHEQQDPMVKVKLFNPTGIGTWWIAGYDPETGLAWGAAELFEREVGDFSMHELIAVRGLMGLPLERDLHWAPRMLSVVLAEG